MNSVITSGESANVRESERSVSMDSKTARSPLGKRRSSVASSSRCLRCGICARPVTSRRPGLVGEPRTTRKLADSALGNATARVGAEVEGAWRRRIGSLRQTLYHPQQTRRHSRSPPPTTCESIFSNNSSFRSRALWLSESSASSDMWCRSATNDVSKKQQEYATGLKRGRLEDKTEETCISTVVIETSMTLSIACNGSYRQVLDYSSLVFASRSGVPHRPPSPFPSGPLRVDVKDASPNSRDDFLSGVCDREYCKDRFVRAKGMSLGGRTSTRFPGSFLAVPTSRVRSAKAQIECHCKT